MEEAGYFLVSIKQVAPQVFSEAWSTLYEGTGGAGELYHDEQRNERRSTAVTLARGGLFCDFKIGPSRVVARDGIGNAVPPPVMHRLLSFYKLEERAAVEPAAKRRRPGGK